MKHLFSWDSPCHLCGTAIEGRAGLCPACRRALPRHDGKMPRLTGIDAVKVAFWYDYPLIPLVRAFKYQGALHLADVLASGWEGLLPQQPPDCVVPVPLSRRRWRERGYNQAHELALELGSRLGSACTPALLRQRHTAPQAGLSAQARATNVARAFCARTPLRGLRVALVDDVLTTGATLEAAAQALRDAGARQVEAWVVARAVLPL